MLNIGNMLVNFSTAMEKRKSLYSSIEKSALERMIYEKCESVPLFSHVVILNGTGGSGKSTLVDICDEISKGENIDVFVNELSSIDPIRNAVSNIIGDCNEKDEKYRMLLCKMKAAWVEYDDFGPTYYISDNINSIIKNSRMGSHEFSNYWYNKFANIIFVHVREPEEIVKLRNILYGTYGGQLGVTSVLITGRVDPQSHISDSDRNVNNYTYDIVINNNEDILYLYKYASLLMGRCLISIFEQAKCDIEHSIKCYYAKTKILDKLTLPDNQDSIV